MHKVPALILLLALALPAAAKDVRPDEMSPLIAPGYEPQDDDERGLWYVSEKIEEAIAQSNLVERDESLNAYVRGVVERLLGEHAADLRIYIVRDPSFNASMFPNGMMLVHTGLLVRMRNEAQLAAVLGHEAGHHLRRHSLDRWRSVKKKTAIMSVIALGGAAATGASGGTTNWYDVANAVNAGIVLSIFQHSRGNETEADAYGLRLLTQSNYAPDAAAQIWSQVVEEQKASAKMRDKRYRDRSRSALSTHPPSEDRMRNLAQWAGEAIEALGPNASFDTGQDRFEAVIAPLRASMLEEQVRLNDVGAGLYLINSLAESGWTSELKYYLGEVYTLRSADGDAELAAEAYAQAAAFENPHPQALRAHGYAQLKKGNKDAAREALSRYLELRPDAPDAAMIQFSIAQ